MSQVSSRLRRTAQRHPVVHGRAWSCMVVPLSSFGLVVKNAYPSARFAYFNGFAKLTTPCWNFRHAIRRIFDADAP